MDFKLSFGLPIPLGKGLSVWVEGGDNFLALRAGLLWVVIGVGGG